MIFTIPLGKSFITLKRDFMIEPTVELKVLLSFIYRAKSSQQIETAKKRIKELVTQLKLEDIKKDFL